MGKFGLVFIIFSLVHRLVLAHPGSQPSQMDRAVDSSQEQVSLAATCTSQEARDLFEKIKSNSNISHEVTEDGCHARALLACNEVEELNISCKLARAETKTAFKVKNIWDPRGVSDWELHYAVVLNVRNQLQGDSVHQLVIEPSLFDEPVSLETWLEKLSPGFRRNPENKVTILEPWIPSPKADMIKEARKVTQRYYLPENKRRKKLFLTVKKAFEGVLPEDQIPLMFNQVLRLDHRFCSNTGTRCSSLYDLFAVDELWNEIDELIKKHGTSKGQIAGAFLEGFGYENIYVHLISLMGLRLVPFSGELKRKIATGILKTSKSSQFKTFIDLYFNVICDFASELDDKQISEAYSIFEKNGITDLKDLLRPAAVMY